MAPMAVGIGLGVSFGGKAGAGAPAASDADTLFGAETNGLTFSSIDNSCRVKDTTTPANNYTGDLPTKLGSVRASSGMSYKSNGTLEVIANTLRRDYDPRLGGISGHLIEGTNTNYALWNRDLTNAAWVKTNATALKDQVGVDGVAASASSLTASGANGTCLQTITDASKARYQSCFIKRITGSGVVSMTLDNVTFTPVTVTSAWLPVEIPTQTLANPVIGFRLATSGDAVAIDMVQSENSTYRSSPIITTTASATRAADLPSTTACPFSDTGGTLVADYARYSDLLTAGVGLAVEAAGPANRIFFRSTLALGVSLACVSATVTTGSANAGSISAAPARNKVAAGYELDNFAITRNGNAAVTDLVGAMPIGPLITLKFGQSNLGEQTNGWLITGRYFPRRVTNAELVVMST